MVESDVDNVLTLIGFGRMQALMVFSCGMIGIYVTNEVMGISSMVVSIGCDFSIAKNHLSLMSSAAFLGLVLSSHYAGYQTDLIGRRKVILYSLSFAMVASLISISMPNFYLMLFGRFMTGLCLSGAGVNNITYLTEFSQVKMRPRMVNIMSYAFAFAGIYVSLIAYAMEPLNRTMFNVNGFNVLNYRFNMLLNLMPGLFALISMYVLPESAKFLVMIGDTQRAFLTLDRLCMSNRGQDLESLGVDKISAVPPRRSLMVPHHCCRRLVNDTVPLFKKPYLRPFLHVTAMLCGFFFVGNGMSLWFMDMRQRFPDDDLILCDMIHRDTFQNATGDNSICSKEPLDYTGGVALGFSFLIICISISLMLFFLSRSLILFCNASVAALCGLSLNVLTHKVAIFIAMVTFISMCTCSIPLGGSVMVDVVPTHMRGKAVSLSYMFARSSVIISTNIIGNFMGTHCLTVFNVYVLVTTLSAILACCLPAKPEAEN